MAEPRHIVLAAGGTGGHMFPARALAEELLTRGYALTVVSPSSIDLEAATGRIPAGPETVARMERENMVTELRGWGVHIGDWKPGEPVNMALAGVQR